MRWLDAIRGIAATVVIVQHSLELVWPAFERFSGTVFSLGIFGVTVFLIVSGYVIPASLERHHSLRDFWIARFFRLYPMYWVSLAAAVFLSVAGVSGVHYSSKQILLNVTMLQDFLRTPDVLGIYWTLAIEMSLYALYSVLSAMRKLDRTLLTAWAGLCILALGGVLLPLTLHRRFAPGVELLYVSAFFGAVLYKLDKAKISADTVKLLFVVGAAVTVLLSMVSFSFVPQEPGKAVTPLSVVLTTFAAYASFFAVRAFKNSDAVPDWIAWIGRISYSTYLLHPLALLVFDGRVPAWAFPVLVLAAAIGVSGLTFRFIETPMNDLGKRLQQKKGKTTASADGQEAVRPERAA